MRAIIIAVAAVSGALLILTQALIRADEDAGEAVTEDEAVDTAVEFLEGEDIAEEKIESLDVQDDDEQWIVEAEVTDGEEEQDLGVRVEKESGDVDWD